MPFHCCINIQIYIVVAGFGNTPRHHSFWNCLWISAALFSRMIKPADSNSAVRAFIRISGTGKLKVQLRDENVSCFTRVASPNWLWGVDFTLVSNTPWRGWISENDLKKMYYMEIDFAHDTLFERAFWLYCCRGEPAGNVLTFRCPVSNNLADYIRTKVFSLAIHIGRNKNGLGSNYPTLSYGLSWRTS